MSISQRLKINTCDVSTTEIIDYDVDTLKEGSVNKNEHGKG